MRKRTSIFIRTKPTFFQETQYKKNIYLNMVNQTSPMSKAKILEAHSNIGSKTNIAPTL